MVVNDLSTEELILQAAEAEFLEKGFGNAKMMSIAKKADVAHSMLHYYFGSKKKLFQRVFLQKTQFLQPLFESVLEQQLSFLDTLRLLMETQFNFLMQNPKLPFFLLTEALTNKENKDLLLEVLSQSTKKTFAGLNQQLEAEIEKGNLRNIKIQDLLLNFISLNISSFLVLPVLQEITDKNTAEIEKLLLERRDSNIEFVLAALRP